ncbi:FAD-dependent oxidoreductase [Thermodesulfobacteriota bacterium]
MDQVTVRAVYLGIQGEDSKDVLQGLPFLKDVNLGKKVKVGKKVVVIGGGNVAMDVALTAKRLGAQVSMVCLEGSKEEMPAYDDEIDQAKEEGIKIEMGWGPTTILGGKKKVTGVDFKCCTSVFDKDGKFCPMYDESKTKSIDADMVITAIGQATDLSFIQEENMFDITPGGTIKADSGSLSTNIPGIFVGGDAARGPARMIDAIADGKKAAKAIDYYLQCEDLPPEADPIPLADIETQTFKFHLRDTAKEDRYESSCLPGKERAGNFNEVNKAFDKETCIKEARRCISCRCTAMPY